MSSEAFHHKGHQHIYYKEGNTKVARAALCIHRIHHIKTHPLIQILLCSSQFILGIMSAVLLQFNSTCWTSPACISFLLFFLWQAGLVLLEPSKMEFYAMGWAYIWDLILGVACMGWNLSVYAYIQNDRFSRSLIDRLLNCVDFLAGLFAARWSVIKGVGLHCWCAWERRGVKGVDER
jgi:hypothetical protein